MSTDTLPDLEPSPFERLLAAWVERLVAVHSQVQRPTRVEIELDGQDDDGGASAAPGHAGDGQDDDGGASAAPGHAGDGLDQLSAILASVSALAGTRWRELDGYRAHRALGVLEEVDRRLAGVRSTVVSTIEDDGLWALDGQRTFKTWLRDRTAATPSAAGREVRHARALRDHLPLTRGALESGRIGREHVDILVREAVTTDRLRAQLADEDMGEAFLVARAQEMDAGTFAKLVKHWRIAADPEGSDRAWRDAGTKEQLTLARTLDGYHLAGWLDTASGQVVETALRAHMGRKAKDDERTPAQRRAAALTSLARQSLDAGLLGKHSRIRPHLTVTMTMETVRTLAAATGSARPPQRSDGTPHSAGAAFGFDAESTFTQVGGPRDPHRQEDLFELSAPAREWHQQWSPGDDHVISAAVDPSAMVGVEPATLEDGTPIPPALLARLACDSGLSRVVFGPESTVLDAGREQRIFPAHMVRAIVARDRTCRYPGCDEPPGFGEIHHSLQWYRDGGPTSVELGILLCWHHHDWVHAHGITIARSKGEWFFYDRHGWLIEAPQSDEGTGVPSAG